MLKRKCAFLTTNGLEDFFVYDDLLKPHLQKLGWEIEDVLWKDQDIDYDSYDVVIVRSTWDYQQHLDEFIQCLERIEESKAILQNPFELMKWNISKLYLRDLSERGVPVLPSLWQDSYSFLEVMKAFSHFNTDKIVIKPLVSANADDTFCLNEQTLNKNDSRLSSIFGDKGFMLQAFEPAIVDPGEYSLFYFDEKFSHAILKTPKVGDFRVQEEHGGQLKAINATEAMLNLAKQTLLELPQVPFYARIDMLQTQRGFELIEVELIEPSLYFNMDNQSAQRFAKLMNDKYSG